MTPEPSNGTNGHSLTIKAGNAVAGPFAQTGGDLILEAGNGFNINQAGADGGDLILRSGGNSRSTASTDDGGDIVFQVGSFNSTFIEKARLLESGKFGIGTATPVGLVEASSNSETDFFATSFSTGSDPNFIGRRARGTAAAPTAVLTNDNLAFFGGRGFGATSFAALSMAVMAFQAAENWTDTAQGTQIAFQTVLNGGTTRTERLRIENNGNVNIGTSTVAKFNVNTTGLSNVTTLIKNDANANIPLMIQGIDGTALAQFQDPRPAPVGGGTGITFSLGVGVAGQPGGGTWANTSDRRLKKNIEPLTGALDRLLQLRSVTYEYIDPAAIHEPTGTQIGFIAQEVEPIFPGWVGEKADGYKYLAIKGFESLTVQALRELRSEKDAEIAALKQKVAALEARDQAREARLTRLESALDDRPARTVRTSLDFK